MARRSQADLIKIGKEGFELIDECFGQPTRKRSQAPVSVVAQRATPFQANPQVSHHRYHPKESYYRYQYQPQESHVVRVSKVYTADATV
jgi:hypothetical protein